MKCVSLARVKTVDTENFKNKMSRQKESQSSESLKLNGMSEIKVNGKNGAFCDTANM